MFWLGNIRELEKLVKVVLDNFYAGYAGGIRLIEDIYTVAVSRFN